MGDNQDLQFSMRGDASPPARSCCFTPGMREVRALTAFLVLLVFKEVALVISGLMPIIQQPSSQLIGRELKFGRPYVSSDVLDQLGVKGYDIAGLDPFSDQRLVDLNLLQVNVTDMSYEEVLVIAERINEGAMQVGVCKAEDASGGLAETEAEFLTFGCTPLSDSTKQEMRRWIELEKEACFSEYLELHDIFHNCLKFSSHNPGSFYVIGGSATYEHNMECSFPEINLRSWNFDHGDIAGTVRFADFNTHTLECKGPMLTGVQHGFVSQRQMYVKQIWYQGDEFEFRENCRAQRGSLDGLRLWSGDYEVGLHQIVAWCADQGLKDAEDCWDSVFSLLDPLSDSYIGWLEVGREFPVSVLKEKMEGTLDYPMKCFEYHSTVDEQGLVNRDAFRRTFGWGWDIDRVVIDRTRWQTTAEALYKAQILTGGTSHDWQVRCFTTDDEGKKDILDEKIFPKNWRAAGESVTVPLWSKCINFGLIFGMIVVTGIENFRLHGPKDYFYSGIMWIFLLAAVWIFETAVSTQVIDSCEIRVYGLFRGHAQSFLHSVLDRMCCGAFAANLTQTVCWLLNPWNMSTGELPFPVQITMTLIGFLYAVFISSFSLESTQACAVKHEINSFDIYLPLVFGLVASPIVLIALRRRIETNACVAWERDVNIDVHDNSESSLNKNLGWGCRLDTVSFKKPNRQAIGVTYGLRLFRVLIVDGPILFHEAGFEHNAEYKQKDLPADHLDRFPFFATTTCRDGGQMRSRVNRFLLDLVLGKLFSIGICYGLDADAQLRDQALASCKIMNSLKTSISNSEGKSESSNRAVSNSDDVEIKVIHDLQSQSKLSTRSDNDQSCKSGRRHST